jgi:4-amino-4-deoxy-L-arabinose transferase-like glycosyltransferase
VVAAGFFPWVILLPALDPAVRNERLGGRLGKVLLLSWFIPPFVMFSLVATKLPHYVLPLLPALALAAGGTLDAAIASRLSDHETLKLRHGPRVAGTVAVILAIGIGALPWLVDIRALFWPCTTLALVILLMTALAIGDQLAGRVQRAAGILLGLMAVFLLSLALFILPGVEPYQLSPAIGRTIRSEVPDDVPVSMYEYTEPSMIFYLGRPIGYLGSDDEVLAWARQPGPAVCILPWDHLTRISREHEQQLGTVRTLAAVNGLNHTKGRREVIAILVRNLPPA